MSKPKKKIPPEFDRTGIKAEEGDLRLGNRFWELRSKHGRDKLFVTPELLWEACCEYFKWCEDNPFVEQDFMNSKEGPIEIGRNKMRPFTLHGLCIYLDCNTVYFNQFENSLKDKTDELSKEFSKVVHNVREIIYNQKFSGAASGFFNANIIARDLGLQDKADLTSNGETIRQVPWIDLPPKSE